MRCKECIENPVIVLPETQQFCKHHFIKYFESKVIRTIKKYNLIENKDRIAVALSGGKDSLSLLYILNKYLKNQKKKVIAILIDEGINGYRNKTIKDAEKFCKKEKIELSIVSFKKEIGKTLDEMITSEKSKKIKKQQEKINPCAICGVFRRYLLNKAAKNLGLTKIATGHNLDDEAQSFVMNQLKANWKRNATLGPWSGANENEKFSQRIKPLCFLSEKEVATYSFLMNFPVSYNECPHSHDSFRADVRDFLNSLEEKHPGSKHALINSLLEILPLVKEKYKHENYRYCKICSEPSSKEICNSCSLMEKLKLNR